MKHQYLISGNKYTCVDCINIAIDCQLRLYHGLYPIDGNIPTVMEGQSNWYYTTSTFD